MTPPDRKELIAWLESRYKDTPMPGAKRMFKLALDAIREKTGNDPLTRKHLCSMNDQRVWVQYAEIGMFALVAYNADDDDGDDVYLTNNLGGRSTFEEVLEQGGVAYRRPLEGEAQ